MNVDENQLQALLSGLSPSRVSARTQSGRKLSYVEAYDVRATLNRIFGFLGWSLTEDVEVTGKERDVPNSRGGTTNFRICARAKVRITIHGMPDVHYDGTASASQAGSDPGEVEDFAVKTAASDALKRAAMNLGTQFGLSLYDNGSLADVVGDPVEPKQRKLIIEARKKRTVEVTGAIKDAESLDELGDVVKKFGLKPSENLYKLALERRKDFEEGA